MEWLYGGTLLLAVIASLAVGWGFDSWQQAAGFIVVLAAALGCVYRGLKGIFERDQWLTKVPALEDAVKTLKDEVKELRDELQDRHRDYNELRRALEENTEWKRDTPRLPRYPRQRDD